MKEEKLQEAKRLYESANADQKYVLESLFPELAGSEDEKTRKEIVDYLKKNLRFEWATWLEKQGEQKSQRMISAEVKEAMYDKPAWSEEDDVRLQACIDTLQAKSLMGKVDTVMTNWLKSLKQRIGG